MTTGGAGKVKALKPRPDAPVKGMAIELRIECGDGRVADALNQALMPDNRYFPKDQKFQASKEGSVIRFVVASLRARPVVTTVASIISDARLFRDIWLEAETRKNVPR